MLRTLAAATAIALAALGAQAEERIVRVAGAQAALSEGPMELVYRAERGAAGLVTIAARYAPDAGDGRARRLILELADDEEAVFSTLAHPDVLYRFWRRGDRVLARVEILSAAPEPDLARLD